MDLELKRRRVRFVAASAAALTLFFGAVAVSGEQGTPAAYFNQPAQMAPEQESDEYIVCARDGLVVVYTSAQPDTPFLVTTIRLSRLRSYDQQSLRAGIAVSGKAALQELLEDFGS